MTKVAHQKQYYPALDGLRGLAILFVVFFHNFGFINYSVFGWIGVDLFFVLSGYLITDILLTTVGSPGYLRNFFARRVLRIFPLYYLSLAIFLLILPKFDILKNQLQFYVDHQWWLWAYLQNWLYSFHTPRSTFLIHFWSLAVEEQFYLIWPFVILLIRKPKHLLVLMFLILGIVMLVRSLLWINRIETVVYSSLYTFTRIDGICIGCIVAITQRINFYFLKNNTAIIITGLAALNFIFYFLNMNSNYPYLAFVGYTTLAGIFGLLVNESVTGGTKIINFIFTFAPLKFFGKISYAFYVFHWPVYLIIYRLAFDLSPYRNLFISFTATILAVGLSWLSYEFFESKMLRLKRNFEYTIGSPNRQNS